ncbi:MAG: YbjN domain-containing protein [Terracidiphilus sp.]|jgi:hypothetical protein
MSTTHLRVFLLCAVSYLCATALEAQGTSGTQSNPPLVNSMTIESFQQRVQALGFSTSRGSTDGKPDAYFIFMSEGRKIGGLVINPTVVELFISYSDGPTLEDLNEWNHIPIGTTAFVNEKGGTILTSELFLEGGITEQNVNAFITRFRDAASAYARFITEHKKKP